MIEGMNYEHLYADRVTFHTCFVDAAAAKTYFNSANGTEQLRASGKYKDKCVKQRTRNRLMRVS